MPIIAPDDLASYLRVKDPDREAVELLTELANGIVEELPITFTDPVPIRVKAITLEVAARAYRNPEGLLYERGDDYGYGRPYNTQEAGIYLTDGERSTLADLGTVVVSGSALSVEVFSPLDLP